MTWSPAGASGCSLMGAILADPDLLRSVQIRTGLGYGVKPTYRTGA